MRDRDDATLEAPAEETAVAAATTENLEAAVEADAVETAAIEEVGA